jgi:hypothetical protein
MDPISGSAPTTGKPFGPGGSFLRFFLKRKLMMKRVIKKMKKEIESSLKRKVWY